MPKVACSGSCSNFPGHATPDQEVAVFEDVEDPQVDEDIRIEEVRRRITGQPR